MTVNDMRTEAKKHGATVENDSSKKWCVYQCCTPRGKRWSCAGVHMLKVEWRRDEDKYRDDAIADALDRMKCGVEECDDEECDYCTGEGYES